MTTISNISCNICCEDFDTKDIITLSCHPSHTYCNNCITDWFQKNIYLKDECRECPTCKKKVNVIPILNGCKKIKYIHYEPEKRNYPMCDIKDCDSKLSYHISYPLNTDNYETSNTENYYICASHLHHLITLDTPLVLKNNKIGYKKSLECSCLTLSNEKCYGLVQFNKNDPKTYINMNNEKYPICENHSLLYNNNLPITMFDNSIMVKYTEITGQKICGKKNKTNFGYCLESFGNCIKHNKKENEISLSFKETMEKIICNEPLKSGNGNCKNKGKSIYNGKCGKHIPKL